MERKELGFGSLLFAILKTVSALKILCSMFVYLVTTLCSRKAFVIYVFSKYH